MTDEQILKEINPVFLTARSSIYRFALWGDETAKKIVAFLEKDGPKELFRNVPDKITGPARLVLMSTLEARYRTADERITYDNLQQPVGNTGAALEKIVVSPISMEIFYHLPRSVQIETGYHEEMVTEEDGTQHMESVPFTYESFEEPPSVQGVRMKDGTVLMGLNAGPGASGYTDQTGETWVERFGTGKILDPENIAAVLFLDRDTLPANGEVDITEENCIEIPIC